MPSEKTILLFSKGTTKATIFNCHLQNVSVYVPEIFKDTLMM